MVGYQSQTILTVLTTGLCLLNFYNSDLIQKVLLSQILLWTKFKHKGAVKYAADFIMFLRYLSRVKLPF